MDVKKIIGAIVGGIFILGCMYLFLSGGGSDNVKIEFDVTADQLYQDYEDNEVKAISLYKGKTGHISGRVKSIGADITDNPYVMFESSGFFGVQCMFGDGGEDIMNLSSGTKIKVRGRVSGTFGNIIVRDCKLIN